MRNNREKTNKIRDEQAIVLDIVSDYNNYRDSSIVQAIGTKTYSLLELIPKEGVNIKNGDVVYIGDGKRDDIQYIKRALYPNKLSTTAKSELLFTIMDIIDEREDEYVNFLNTAGPITIRKHAVELIPGVGKKHLQSILKLRDEKKFENFKDISARCSFLPDPQKALATRIMDEIEGNTDHLFFIQR